MNKLQRKQLKEESFLAFIAGLLLAIPMLIMALWN